MIKELDYWYDGQMRRYLNQIVRAFSGFQYMTGWSERNGVRVPPQLVMVPCTMAVTDRQVAAIIKNNSASTLNTVPRITVFQTGLTFRREELQNPNFIGTVHAVEREIDPATNKYTGKRGRSYTVERMMGLPFEMTIQVDIWTATLDQKHQLAEQILTVVAPDFAIQNSDNALDWTAITTMKIEDINLSSRSVSIGTENEIDIMTMTFRLPFWLSPPAKVQQQNLIEQIVTNIHDGRTEDDISDQNLLSQQITTPGNHSVRVSGNKIQLLNLETDPNAKFGPTDTWEKLIRVHGSMRPTISKIRLKTDPEQIDDWSHDIVGTIQFDSANPDELFWTLDPDTLPANTLPPLDAIVNPVKVYPGNGLPPAANGNRYLLLHDLGPSEAWGQITALENDIVEYRNGVWRVLFRPVMGDFETRTFVLNLHTGTQIRWNGEDWVLTIDGDYPPGYWRMSL